MRFPRCLIDAMFKSAPPFRIVPGSAADAISACPVLPTFAAVTLVQQSWVCVPDSQRE